MSRTDRTQKLIDKQKEANSKRYAIKDGFRKILREPYIFLASVSTMTLMLIVTSIFLIFAVNASHIVETVAQQPPVEIQFSRTATPEEVRAVDRMLGDDVNVLEHKVFTPEQNFNDFCEKIGKDELFEDFDYRSYIPYTIRLRLDRPAKADTFREEIMQMHGVREVLMEEALMEFLNKAMQKIGLIVAIIFAGLSLITIFIIYTMVKLAALSRAEEISIMKYLGATDKFIKIPFIVEGLSVGILSALISSTTAMLIYNAVLRNLGGELGTTGVISPLKLIALLPLVLLLCFGVGLSIGGISSALAVRKYVKV